MLLFFPEFRVQSMKESLIFFALLLSIILIFLRNSKKVKDNKYSISMSPLFIFSCMFIIIEKYLFSPSWSQIPKVNFWNIFSYVGLLIYFGWTIYYEIKAILIYIKTKSFLFVIIETFCCFIVMFGFALSLFKVLQMFKILK